MTKLIAVFLTLLFAVTPNTSSKGTVHGSVKNAETGELLPMSLVYFYAKDNYPRPKFIQTSSGEFTIVEIPAGPYSFFVSREGYRPIVAQQVEVKASAVTELNFVLQQERTRTDSTDVVHPGKPGVDYKMRYVRPDPRKYR